MATEVKRRRGSDSDHVGFTGAVAELTVNTDDWTVHVHDGTNNYGYPLLRQDFDNVPTTAPFTNISLDTAIFDTTYSYDGNEVKGALYWNEDEETLSLVTNGQTTEIGQKVEVHVKNQTGSQIDKGEVVYASGTLGASGRILVDKMKADGTVAAKRVLGVAAENIANGADGKVIKFGKLRKVDTSAFSNGDILWVSTTAFGGFQNTEPVQANGEISLPIAYVVYSSASVGEIFIRVTPIDENEYQDYDAQLTTLSGLSADQAQDLVDITAAEYTQLQNINSVTISNTQWGYLGALDQALATGDSPTFGGLTVNGDISVTGTVDGRDVAADGADLDELYTTIGLSALTSDEVNQLENIGSTTISATQWGYLGVLDQNLRTTDAVTFATVDTGQGANELYAMNQDVQTTDDVTFNIINVSDSITDASTTYSAGITGVGTIYDMNDGNGSFFEVDNMRVRNELRAHVFKKDIVKASNAYLFITDSAEIAEFSEIIDTTDTFRVLADGSNASFAHGDLLWAKNIDDDGSLQVAGVKIEVSVQPQFVWDTSTETWNTTTITPDSYTEFASGTVTGGIHDGKTYTEYNIYEVTNGGNLNAGDTIVRVSGGSILNDASSAQSPFIDIYDGVNTWADFQSVDKTKVRLGNLAGVSNASGYGLYTQNAFLTGALVVGDLTKVGQYMEFDGSTLTVQGNIVVQGGSGIASFTDAGAFATLSAIDSGNATTYIGAGAITTGLIAANTIVAGNIASGTITATEISTGTITANEIAAGTITANEIDVADLFSQNATVAGTLTIGSGGSLASSAVNFGQNTFSLDVTDLDINSTNALIQVGHDTTSYSVKLGLTDVSSAPNHGGKYGLEIDANNYWKAVKGFDTDPDRIEFKVGDGSNYLDFDGTDLTIVTDNFDLATSTFVIDSDNNKIALGTSPDSITIAGTEAGFIANGSGEFKGYIDANNYIRLDSSGLDIKAETFDLVAGDLTIDSANREIQIADNTTRKVTINDDTTFTTVQTLGTGTGLVEIDDLDTSDGTVESTTSVVNVSTYKGDRIDFTVDIDYTETALGTANTLVGVSLELAEEGGIADYVEETFVFHRFTTGGNGSVTLSGSFKTQTNDINPASGFGYRLRFYANEGGQREGNLDFDYTITIYNQETQINKGGFISQSSPTNFISDEKIAGNFELDLPIVTGLTYDDLFPYRGKVVKYQSESDKTGTNPATGGSVTIKPYQIIQLDFTEV